MAAPYNPPRKGEDFRIRIGLEDYDNPGNLQPSPTIAAGDFKVDKDGAGFNNLVTLPSVSPAGGVAVLVALSASEMDADVVTIACIDQTATKEWADRLICIPTTA